MSEGIEETRSWPAPSDEDEAPEENVAPEVAEPEPAAPPAETPEVEEVPAEEDELPRERYEHASGQLRIPDGYGVIQGEPSGSRRAVGVVVGRFNSGLTGELLTRALDELEQAGVGREAVTVVPADGCEHRLAVDAVGAQVAEIGVNGRRRVGAIGIRVNGTVERPRRSDARLTALAPVV